MTDFRTAPSRERLETLLETLEPGSKLEHISMFPQSFSNATHLINARTKTGTSLQVVLRHYNPANESPARKTVRDHVAHLTSVPSRFSHIDFWSGNILWKNTKISAILDWEEAARCDPAYDLAYARMELSLLGLEDTARVLLETYQAETGKPVENLAFWELAASVRSMPDPAGWIPEWVALGHPGFDDTTVRKRLRGFIARAHQNIGV